MTRAFIYTGLLSLAAVVGCGKPEAISTNAGDTTQRVMTQSTGISVNAVASDKELLRQALVLADSKGTLEAGLTEAAQDSLVGPKMRAALALSAEAKHMTTPAPRSGKTTTTTTHTTTQKTDALDKANSSLDRANTTVTKSGEVIQKTQQVGNKIGDILNNRH